MLPQAEAADPVSVGPGLLGSTSTAHTKNPAGAGFFRVTLRLAEHDGAALTYQLQQPLLRDGLQRGQLR